MFSKRIAVYERVGSEWVRRILELQSNEIQVRSVKTLHTRLAYVINPAAISYRAYRSKHYGRKSFAVMRSNPYPWIVEIKPGRGHLSVFRIDSEKSKQEFEKYIRQIKTVS